MKYPYRTYPNPSGTGRHRKASTRRWSMTEALETFEAHGGLVDILLGVAADADGVIGRLLGNGYRAHNVTLEDGTIATAYTHRLVAAKAFYGIPDGFIVDHVNGDTLDNSIYNLQLLTPSENRLKARWRDPLTRQERRAIQRQYKLGGVTQMELAHAFRCTQGTISTVVNGAPA